MATVFGYIIVIIIAGFVLAITLAGIAILILIPLGIIGGIVAAYRRLTGIDN